MNFNCPIAVYQFVHCFLAGQKTFLSYAVGLIDVGLTSSIGLSFLFNGLVDVGVMKENTLSSFVVATLSLAFCLCPNAQTNASERVGPGHVRQLRSHLLRLGL